MNKNNIQKRIYQYRWGIGIIVFCICVLLELHGSSIGIYSTILHTPDTVVLGMNRPIRSDEWVVNTPLAFSQYFNSFGYFSNIVRGTSTDMFMVYGQAVWDWPIIFRPFLWGYLLLGAAKGLSFFWMGRWITLFLISFDFGMIVYRNNKLLSLTYAGLLAFAPIVQWWFAVNSIVEILIFGQAGVLLVHLYLTANDFKWRLLYGLLLSWVIGVYVFAVYPAWQIPCAYIFGFISFWIIWNHRKENKISKKDIACMSVFLAILSVAVVSVFTKSIDMVSIMKQTDYPGSRNCTGGEIPFINFFKVTLNYIWGIWLPKVTLMQGTNNCEAARFFDLAPLGIILSIWYQIKSSNKDTLLNILLILQAVFVGWMMISWTPIIAKLTLFSNVTASRLILGFGLVNIILLLRTLSLDGEIKESKKNAVLISCIGGIVGCYCAWSFYPSLFGYKKVIVSFVGIFLLWYCVYRKNIRIFSMGVMLAVLFSGICVNPLAHGVESIYQSPVVQKIQEIASHDDGLWVTVDKGDEIQFNDVPIMAGAKSINSINIYPAIQRWEQIDVEKRYHKVYNRYAHISIQLGSETSFKEISADHFTVSLSYEDAKKLGIKYIFTYYALSGQTGWDTHLMQVYEDGNLRIYNVL